MQWLLLQNRSCLMTADASVAAVCTSVCGCCYCAWCDCAVVESMLLTVQMSVFAGVYLVSLDGIFDDWVLVQSAWLLVGMCCCE